jgi:hypothetical protein
VLMRLQLRNRTSVDSRQQIEVHRGHFQSPQTSDRVVPNTLTDSDVCTD